MQVIIVLQAPPTTRGAACALKAIIAPLDLLVALNMNVAALVFIALRAL